MMRLLDTSICIPLINGADAQMAQRLLAQPPGSVVLCSVVRAEFCFGAHDSARAAENRQESKTLKLKSSLRWNLAEDRQGDRHVTHAAPKPSPRFPQHPGAATC